MITEGLRTSLNAIRETSIENGTLYHRQIDEILPTTDIGSFASPLLSNPNLMNEFMNVLVQRIVYTQIVNYKLFNSQLKVLEGDKLPLGSVGQEIFINSAKGRKFNVDDFAGLLAKYEADVKVQYHHLNSDIQYPVTITRAKLKDAFTSWDNLESFVNGITQSLYNGAYIDRYNMTKGLITSAYQNNNVIIERVSSLNSENVARQFITKAREIFLNMQTPTPNYNAWRKVGGYGRDVLTWTEPQDIVFIIRNDIASYIDVNILANAFNIDKTTLLGNIIYVNDFNEYDSTGELLLDGTNIYAMMCDKAWFRIKEQEVTMDEFYNANNRTWQMYLNDVRMYSYSLFANAVCFATADPEVTITAMSPKEEDVSVSAGSTTKVDIITTPFNANYPTITVTSSDSDVATATISGKTVTITGVASETNADGEATITVTAGNVTTTIDVTVPYVAPQSENL